MKASKVPTVSTAIRFEAVLAVSGRKQKVFVIWKGVQSLMTYVINIFTREFPTIGISFNIKII